ncbi:DNAse [Paraburkholderia tropica]|nr:HNH endonuclease [Paraburkholderia tropica]CAG9195825.1 DNAse [Paraburkholderia tropica]
MPKKAPTKCRHHGCCRLIDEPGFCEAHASETAGWNRNPHRGSRHARGYGSKWVKLREKILKRDNGLCQPCLALGRVAAARHVDHIVSKAEGGTDDESNLQSICVACHKAKTADEGARGRARR